MFTSRRLTTLSANLICMASMLVWAAGLPAADLLIGPLTPLPLTALRMLTALALLLPLWLALEGAQTLRRASWGRGLFVGGIGFGLGAYLLVFAQSLTDAITIAVITAAMPVIGITLECLLDGRRLSGTLILGVALSLGGGLLSYGGKLGSVGFGFGALMAVVSVVCYTWGSRATVKSFPDLSPLGRATVTLAGATAVTTLAAGLQVSLGGPSPDWTAIGLPQIVALLIYGIGALAVSQVLWIISVGHLGIGVASLHGNATPFYVMIFLVMLGGSWSWTQALAATIVVLGVLVAQGRMPRRTAETIRRDNPMS